MKKTIALIAVLCCPAVYALGLSDATISSTSPDKDQYTSPGVSGDFTMTLTLDTTKLASVFSNTSVMTTIATLDSGTDKHMGIHGGAVNTNGGVYFSAGGNTAGTGVTYASGQRSTPVAVTGYTNVTNGTLMTMDFSTIATAVVTMGCGQNVTNGTSNGSIIVLTLTDNEGATTTYAGYSNGYRYGSFGTPSTFNINRDLVTSFYVFDSYATLDESIALNVAAAAVPEPTTATLSLLALAGLVTRRRRK